MNPPLEPRRPVWLAVLCLGAAAAVLASPGPERTLFRDLPPNDPVREVIGSVLGSRFYSLRDRFSAEEWSGAGYGAAWDRARSYFPGQTYFVRPGTYFMTHGFDADGRLFMEIHDSPYLALCVENRRTFESGSIVDDYGRMRAAANGREAAGFREKLGPLEAGFLAEKARRDLRRALGEPLYARLLEAFREEDYHMLAGGLMHEGMHAGLSDTHAARLQTEFKAGKIPVQWDELRAFMAEIGYQARFSAWAAGEVRSGWGRMEPLLKGLEAFRRTSRLPVGGGRSRFDQIRTQAWAQAALLRLRARELWQSARRMQELASDFRRDYVRSDAPQDLETSLAGLERDMSAIVSAAGEAIQSDELALRALETVLNTWGAWADGRRPFPPPVTDSRAVVKQAQDIRWPVADTAAPAALMRRAGQELAKDQPAS